jgi:hypothetical protein
VNFFILPPFYADNPLIAPDNPKAGYSANPKVGYRISGVTGYPVRPVTGYPAGFSVKI